MKVEEYLSAYEKLLEKIEALIDQDQYSEVMGLISEIDHIIALIEKEVSTLSEEEKAKIKPRAQEIIRKQEEILATIDKKVNDLQSNINMIPKLQQAAKTYGKNI